MRMEGVFCPGRGHVNWVYRLGVVDYTDNLMVCMRSRSSEKGERGLYRYRIEDWQRVVIPIRQQNEQTDSLGRIRKDWRAERQIGA